MLNYKRRLFIKEYTNCLNGAEAYRRVYGNSKFAKDHASRLLAKEEIKTALDNAMKDAIDISKDEFCKILKNEHENNNNTSSTRLKALELFGKVKGYINPEVSNQVAVINSIQDLEKRLKD